MKKWIVLIALLIPVSMYSQSACTDTINGDRTTVANWFATSPNAIDGYVLCLNAGGPYTYSSQVDITKGATIAGEVRGAGGFVERGSAGQTIIYVQSGSALGGYEVTGSTYNPTISNIRFTMDTSTSTGAYAIGNSAAGGIGRPWIVHHNDFLYTGPSNCNAKALLFGTGHGVFYRNKFIGPSMTVCTGGYTNMQLIDASYSDPVAGWESASTFGSADSSDTSGMKNYYFENNYCEGFLGSDVTAAGRMVWRFNEMHQCNVTTHGFDSNVTGVRAYEFYNNTMACDVNKGDVVPILAWFGMIGGTGFMLNNTFPGAALTFCASGGSTVPPSTVNYRRFYSDGVAPWPGAYPDSYPASHQLGWGYISGSNLTIGESTAEANPGGGGFQQALEPFYAANNTNNTGSALISTNFTLSPTTAYGAMTYTNAVKSSATTTIMPSTSTTYVPYISSGQSALVVFVDLIGGTTPTITDTCNGGQTWTARQGGTNGSLRLTAWTAKFNSSCNFDGDTRKITITHDSSAAARVVSLTTIRGLHATIPIDKNPAVTNDSTSPYDATSSGALSQANELIIGYFGMQGPSGDTIAAGSSDAEAQSCAPINPAACTAPYNRGINGTTGSTDTTNVSLIITNRRVTSTSAVQPQATNNNNRTGIAGTITFQCLSDGGITDNCDNLDLQGADFVQENREFYIDQASFNGTVGTGAGPRASRPMTCTTGVAYWSTDQGSWNSLGADGVLDKCTATDTWTDAWYVPKDYPHPLATVTTSTATSHRARRFH